MQAWKFAAIFASVVFGAFSVWGIGQLYESLRGYTWPHVNGTVISSVAHSKLMVGGKSKFMSYWPEVQYEYVVGNRRIVGDRIRFIVRGMNENETQRVVSTYPAGKSVAVYFDPNNAASAVLEQGVWWPMIPILALSLTLALLMPALIYSDFRGRALSASPRPAR
jgi:hypothetical protein